MAFHCTRHKEWKPLKTSVLGYRLSKFWRPFEDWGKLGCTAWSCGGQWFAADKWNEKWLCADCELYFHHGCQKPPEVDEDYQGHRCQQCAVLVEVWHKEWQLQLPKPPPLVAAVPVPVSDQKKRGPHKRTRTFVHDVYKLR